MIASSGVMLLVSVETKPQTSSPWPTWASILVSLVALTFTMLTFWWNNWRRGHLIGGYPRIFGAIEARQRAILAVPVSLFNSGPRPISVRALRLCIPHNGSHRLMFHVRTCKNVLGADPSFATNFVVPGHGTVLLYAEFEASAPWSFDPGPFSARLEVLYDHRKKWRKACLFVVDISEHYIAKIVKGTRTAYDNLDSVTSESR